MKKLLLLMVLLLLFACSADSSEANSVEEDIRVTKSETANEQGDVDESFELEVSDSIAATNRKLIKNYQLTFDTENYQEAKKTIQEAIVNAGGYIQNSNENRYNFYYSYYVIRIPSANTSEFLNDISGIGVSKSSSLDVNDVTESYSDIDARLKSLYIEEETYQNILKEASNVTDVLEIQRALSDTRYQIESYESRKKNYDLLVANDTITLQLNEVKVAVSENDSLFDDISSTFRASIDNLLGIVRSIVVFVLGNIINIILLFALGYLAFKAIKKLFKRKKIKEVQ